MYAMLYILTACIVSILEIIENCLLSLMADHISSSEMCFIFLKNVMLKCLKLMQATIFSYVKVRSM